MPGEPRLVVTVPPPEPGCAQNTRKHWRVRHRADKLARTVAQLYAHSAVVSASWQTADRVRIHIDWYMARVTGFKAKCYHPLDIQNALGALKSTIDGLVDGGVVVSDSHKHVQFGDVRLHRTKKEHQGRTAVVLTVERMGHDDA